MNDSQALEELWYLQRMHQEWASGKLFQRAKVPRATPEMLDAFWADGWRHFGEDFFRDKYSLEGLRLQKIIPLRINVQHFSPKKDQRRILKRSQDFEILIKPTILTEEHYQLFEKHTTRFTQNTPPSLTHFVSEKTQESPCPNMTCEVRSEGKLLAASFVDIGAQALSSVYAIFDPSEKNLSLGNMTLLMEIRFAIMLGKSYLYTGYGHAEPSAYAYKKRFKGTEYYNWAGTWRTLEELDLSELPIHPYEQQDIPEELLSTQEEE